jgi:hypothetical protein
MKSVRLLTISFFMIVFGKGEISAQTRNYESEWKKADDLLLKKNLPKSALAEVKKIYALAKKDKEDAQLIKSLVYMTALRQEISENDEALSIREIEKEIVFAREPAASILKSLLADTYLRYFQNHRWQLYGRTQTVGFKKEDIATWTAGDLHKKIGALYLQSISNAFLLRQTRLAPYDAIILRGNARYLRPTLYDLLAHHALEYFKNDERDIRKPSYTFQIDGPEAFAPAPLFVSHKFPTRDSLSLWHKALLIYQDLIAFHLNDERKDALIDVDLERIEFVYRNSVSENKDPLYVAFLKTAIEKYGRNPEALQAKYLRAAWYEARAVQYDPLKDTAYRYFRNEANAILSAVVKDSLVKTRGWIASYNLWKDINAQSFSFTVEKVNVPGQAFRSLVKYRNVPSLYFRLIPLDEKLKARLDEEDGEGRWTVLTKAPPVRSWKQFLPATNDLQQHAVEIKVDPLPAGAYYLLASSDQAFNKDKHPLGGRSFYVSNISYLNRKDQFFVLHRETGQPLAKATAQVYSWEYNNKTSKNEKRKIGTYTTDANGFFSLPLDRSQGYREYHADLRYQNDRLELDESFNNYDYSEPDENSKEAVKIFFFTDRSIYRPGQTVYFKGIAVRASKGENNIETNYRTTVYLYDANGQAADSVKLTANEFGSFHAAFTLPRNILNGSFRILDKSGNNQAEFSVEEYKRPKFSVSFEEINRPYKVQDTVTITGAAKAFAGNNIDGAKISYRVVRQPRFIYTWFFTKWWQPPVEEMEIAHGETTTDKDGKFSIRFKAIPDRSIDLRYDPVFDYRITADVTDISGETRSGEKTVTAGYRSLILRLQMPERLSVDSLDRLRLRTENLNATFQESSVHVNIWKLLPEERLIRERYWDQPDQFVMSREEYISLFPHDEYGNETDKASWPGSLVYSGNTTSKENGRLEPGPDKALTQGFYRIEVTTRDEEGKEIKDRAYVELFEEGKDKFSRPEYLWSRGSDKALEPGETASVQIGSSAQNVFLIQQIGRKPENKPTEIPIGKKGRQPIPAIEKNEVAAPYGFFTISNEKKTFTDRITEADRGGYGLGFFFVKDNRFYQFSDVVDVPWSNKELNMEYLSFRDKTLPGSEEKWKVRITGYRKEKAAAEMLASMYDLSLDQFRPHQWYAPGLWPSYQGNIDWSGGLNFNSVASEQRWIAPGQYPSPGQTYDELALQINGLRQRGRYISYAFGRSQAVGLVSEGNLAAPKTEMAKFTPPLIKADTQNTQTSSANLLFQPTIQPRKNFNETAFFFPELRTDSSGSIEFSFTAPEALTRWKLLTFAHTKDLAFGLSQKEMVTQKQLMVQPNMPRFLRQGDHLELVTKIVNLSDSEMTGQAQLELIDATTGQSVDGWFINTFPNQYFTVAAGQSELVKFPVQVPVQFDRALTWRITARASAASSPGTAWTDGEEDALPVLSNKILVTETLPLPVRGEVTKNFSFEKLLRSGNSESLQNRSLTIEYTSNPAWYAVQALPYLTEYPYECAEQVWNRYYANALASRIAASAPRIRQIIEKWKEDTAALISNLQKNQALKTALLEETPWVLQANSEAEQKKNLALLFDMVRMSQEGKANLEKLKGMQSPGGGFAWFRGGPDDRYITQYILTGMGHLKKLGLSVDELHFLIDALPYLDKRIKEDYDRLVKSKANLNQDHIGSIQVQYLYLRSFFPELPVSASAQTAYKFYKKQAGQFWMKQSKYLQGMIALILSRSADKQTAAAILQSLKETSISNEEMGMYWKENGFGYSWYWWQAPIETQSLLVETFSEVGRDQKTVDDLRTWLIKNKQTSNWRTTRATADACYAMLLQGSNWLDHEPEVQIKLGNVSISNKGSEAGTGYFEHRIEGKDVQPGMGNISINVRQPSGPASNAPSWGAVYWQYFEDMEKITPAATPLQLNKKLFMEKNSDNGPVLIPLTEGTDLHVGDKIRVRIELRVDRDMEYVQMKDMRASALEPVNVLSGYKWQGGLGYYETTRDASTSFFFNDLRKGTYVFEYPLFVTHTGSFSNGITTIQCMYAPEFSAHSEGMRIRVE